MRHFRYAKWHTPDAAHAAAERAQVALLDAGTPAEVPHG